MGSGARARARAIKPRDNLHVEEAHRVSSSPPGEHPISEARLGSSPTRREVGESRLEARADSGAGTSPSSPLARSAHYLELHAERRRRALEADPDVAQPSEPTCTAVESDVSPRYLWQTSTGQPSRCLRP